ncbi:MAG: Fe(2+)-trafficking protein [Phycisphaerae bacterium]|nr:Fe(2+)-trafficking protein [Phycisphaerae bacterium]
MADQSARIEQFRKMAEADPDNELGHFSLGRALYDAADYGSAILSFDRVIQLNKNLSKVYQLKGSAQLKMGDKLAAIDTLTAGARIASERGDMMPRNEMLKMLTDLGVELPELKKTAAEQPVGEGEVLCHRCGRVKRKLADPPYRNDYGKTIQEKICADCWREWIGMGTKVINELRLPLSDPQAQKVFAQHEREFLNLD